MDQDEIDHLCPLQRNHCYMRWTRMRLITCVFSIGITNCYMRWTRKRWIICVLSSGITVTWDGPGWDWSSVSSPAESLTVTWDGPAWDWSYVSSPAESLTVTWDGPGWDWSSVSSAAESRTVTWDGPGWAWSSVSSPAESLLHEMDQDEMDHLCLLQRNHCYMRWTRMRWIICVLSSGITVTWDGPGWDWSSVSSPAESLLHEMDQDEIDHLCPLQRNHCYMRWTRMRLIICVLSSGITVTWDGPGWDGSSVSSPAKSLTVTWDGPGWDWSSVSSPAESLLHEMDQDEMDHLCPLQRNHCYMRWTRMRWIICVFSSGITVTWDGPGWDWSSVSSPAESLLHEMDQDEIDHLCPLQRNHCYMRWTRMRLIICVLSSGITNCYMRWTRMRLIICVFSSGITNCYMRWTRMRWIICVLSSGITVTWDGPGWDGSSVSSPAESLTVTWDEPGWDGSSVSSPAESLLHEMDQDEMDHLCLLQRNHCYMRWTRMRWIICVLSSGITVTWDGPGWDGSSVSSPAESLLHEMDQDEMDHLCPLQRNHCYMRWTRMRWIICVLSSGITVTWDGPGWDWSSVSSPAESLLHEMDQDEMDHLCPLQRNHCYMRWTRMRWIICVLSSGITVTWDGPGWDGSSVSSPAESLLHEMDQDEMDHLCPLQRNHCYMRWTRMRWIICVLSSGITVTRDGPGWDGSSVSSPAESLLHEMDQDEMDHLCSLQRNHCYMRWTRMRWIICVLSSGITVTWGGPGWDGSSVSSPAESLLHEMDQDEMDHLCPLQRNHCYMRWTRMRWIICVFSSGITVTWDGPGWDGSSVSSPAESLLHEMDQDEMDHLCSLQRNHCYMRWTRMRWIICVLSSGITVTWDGPGWDGSSVFSPAESLLHEMDQDEKDHLCPLQRNHCYMRWTRMRWIICVFSSGITVTWDGPGWDGSSVSSPAESLLHEMDQDEIDHLCPLQRNH